MGRIISNGITYAGATGFNEQILGDFAQEYDSTKTYAVGDFVIYNQLLYKCTTTISTAEAFNSSKWKQTTCGEEISATNSNLTKL